MALQGPSSPSKTAPSLAVLVFVHGFKGDDTTFGDFPSRLQHSIATTLGPDTDVHAWLYPAFETRGELSQCVQRFGEWLALKVTELECEYHANKQAATDDFASEAIRTKELARIVLIGHSMGGIVIADFARSIAKEYASKEEQERMWPRIVGVLGLDTPYLGVQPAVFKNSATDAWGYVQQAQAVAATVGAGWSFVNANGTGKKVPTATSTRSASPANSSKSSSSAKGKQRAQDQDNTDDITQTLSNAGKAASANIATAGSPWAKYSYAAAGAAAFAAAAGTAYFARQKIADTATNSQLWVSSHLEFVGALWKVEDMKDRLQELLDMHNRNVQFFCFYTLLGSDNRTFMILPSVASLPDSYIKAQKRFGQSMNTKAKNEVEAHTAMFDPDYEAVYPLGQECAHLILMWLKSDGRKS